MNPDNGLSGGCHCGNLLLSIELTSDAGSVIPRECDCSFCVKHGARYFSDPLGTLEIKARDAARLTRYRQGSNSAEFLICQNCGVLVAVIFMENGVTYGAVNARSINSVKFGNPLGSSPQSLSPSDRKMRWKSLWFRNVRTP
jgi:hypothetical protein